MMCSLIINEFVNYGGSFHKLRGFSFVGVLYFCCYIFFLFSLEFCPVCKFVPFFVGPLCTLCRSPMISCTSGFLLTVFMFAVVFVSLGTLSLVFRGTTFVTRQYRLELSIYTFCVFLIVSMVWGKEISRSWCFSFFSLGFCTVHKFFPFL